MKYPKLTTFAVLGFLREFHKMHKENTRFNINTLMMVYGIPKAVMNELTKNEIVKYIPEDDKWIWWSNIEPQIHMAGRTLEAIRTEKSDIEPTPLEKLMNGMNSNYKMLFDKCPDEFTATQVVRLGKKVMDYDERTVYHFLKYVVDLGILVRPQQGEYRKITNQELDVNYSPKPIETMQQTAVEEKPRKKRAKTSHKEFLELLPTNFTTRKALNIARVHGIGRKAAANILWKAKTEGRLKSTERGYYIKSTPTTTQKVVRPQSLPAIPKPISQKAIKEIIELNDRDEQVRLKMISVQSSISRLNDLAMKAQRDLNKYKNRFFIKMNKLEAKQSKVDDLNGAIENLTEYRRLLNRV